MGNGTVFQTIIFYFAAILDFGGCMSVWLFMNKKWLNRLLIGFVCILSIIYTSIIIYTFITNPMLLLNMSFSGVQDQYKSNWIIVSSIAHYGVTDIITSRVILYIMAEFQLSMWKYIPLYILLFLWSPIGVLISLIIFSIMTYYNHSEYGQMDDIDEVFNR